MNPVRIGHTISILRKKYGMTQLDLAERLSVTDKAVSRWERGLGAPDISLLVKLSLILDIDVESLLEGNVSVDDLGWKGVLVLNYPDGILPSDLIYTKRIIYLQLCYFLLVGITDVLIVGEDDLIETVKRLLHKGGGMRFEFDVSNSRGLTDKAIKRGITDGVMILSGLDFIYGKDFTKCLRRIMNNNKKPTRLYSFEQRATELCFYPRGTINEDDVQMHLLERGVIHIPIRAKDDLIDAGMLIQIIESHQDEPIMNMLKIAELRHIKSK